MKKSKTASQQKLDYEKVYEHPLDWCPIFGFLPEIDELRNIPEAYLIGNNCLHIIMTARLELGFGHFTQNSILPMDKCKAIRLLFQNLDYLTLKTSSAPEAVDLCRGIVITKQGIPDKPIGKMFNKRKNRYSDLARQINIKSNLALQFYLPPPKQNHILNEAQNIIGDAFKLRENNLYALYAIIEAWLVLTELLFKHSLSKQVNDLSSFRDRLSYADLLAYNARRHRDIEYKRKLSSDNNILEQKVSKHSKGQGDKGKISGKKKREIAQPSHENCAAQAKDICEGKTYRGYGVLWVADKIAKDGVYKINTIRKIPEVIDVVIKARNAWKKNKAK